MPGSYITMSHNSLQEIEIMWEGEKKQLWCKKIVVVICCIIRYTHQHAYFLFQCIIVCVRFQKVRMRQIVRFTVWLLNLKKYQKALSAKPFIRIFFIASQFSIKMFALINCNYLILLQKIECCVLLIVYLHLFRFKFA